MSGWKPRRVPLDNVLPVALHRAEAMPVYRRSMRGPAANEVGATGELVAMEYLRSSGVKFRDDPDVDGDLWVAGQRVEVKTKERTVVPKPHHACSAPAYNHDVQVPDWWLFVSLLSDGSKGVGRFRRAWVCGALPDVRLRAEGVLWRPGDVDGNGWSPTIPVWNVPVGSLVDPSMMWVSPHPRWAQRVRQG
jgi:hypothetical protein